MLQMLLSTLHNPWTLCIAGFIFCLAGVYLFFKNVYEEGRSLYWPVMIMVMGVLLIAVGTARYFKVIA